MSNRSIRVFVLSGLISIIGICLLQLSWFKKAYDKTEQEFDENIVSALNEVVTGILKFNNTTGMPSDPVEKKDANHYIVRVDDQIDPDVLEYYLVSSFHKYRINQQFEFSIFDCANQKMVTGKYVDDLKDYKVTEKQVLKTGGSDNYYFTVDFPHMRAGIIGRMGIWLYSTAVLFIVLLFLGYSLFVILRQKRWSEIQRDFINNITHEFRTPLTSISVAAETLRTAGSQTSAQRQITYATIISEEAARLKNQVDRVLSLADPSSQIKLNKEKFGINDLLTELFLASKNALQQEGEIQLEIEDRATQVYADKLHLRNLISNLIDNALKYGVRTPQIVIRSYMLNQQLHISIADNGIGIAPDQQKRIFEKFYRVPQGNIHDNKGFGIGLHYVQLIARLHKGSIEVKSEPGVGSIFTLKLPLK